MTAKFNLGAFLTGPAWEQLGTRLSLSQRELQISRLVLEDHKESHIAEQLGMSAHTVHTHLDRLYQKLGVNSRVGLVTALLAAFLTFTSEDDSIMSPLCGQRHGKGCPLND